MKIIILILITSALFAEEVNAVKNLSPDLVNTVYKSSKEDITARSKVQTEGKTSSLQSANPENQINPEKPAESDIKNNEKIQILQPEPKKL